ncbi:MAG: signal peptidase I [Candidatus Hadarchaeia archaeon]
MKFGEALGLTGKAILAAILVAIAIPSIIYAFPRVTGADDSYIVVGGSMEPEIMLGDIALIEELPDASTLNVGDIVMVSDESKNYIHRIVDKKISDEETLFQLKGDANEYVDPRFVSSSLITGKLANSVPTGHLFTPYGYLAMFLLPLLVVTGSQIVRINGLYEGRKRKIRKGVKSFFLGKFSGGRRKRPSSILSGTVTIALITVMLSGAFLTAPSYAPASAALFTHSSETEMSVSSDTWSVPQSITCSLNPNYTEFFQSVTLTGELEDPMQGQQIIFEASKLETPQWNLIIGDLMDENIIEDVNGNWIVHKSEFWNELASYSWGPTQVIGPTSSEPNGNYMAIIAINPEDWPLPSQHGFPGIYRVRAVWSGHEIVSDYEPLVVLPPGDGPPGGPY